MGNDVSVFCVDPKAITCWVAQECPEYSSRIVSYQLNDSAISRVPILSKSSTGKSVLRWILAARAIKRYLKQKPDLVFVPFADVFILPALITFFFPAFFPYQWIGLYLQPRYLRVPATRVFKALDYFSIFRQRCCKAVLFLDEGVIGRFNGEIKGQKGIAIPDIADVRISAGDSIIEKELKRRANGRKIVSLFNPAARYKGTLTLYHAAHLEKTNGFFFFFCGEIHAWGFSAEEYRLLMNAKENTPANCYFHHAYIEDEGEYNRLFKCSSVIFSAFHDFYHSSNSLTKAAEYHIPVIVSKGHCLEERINRFRTGIAVAQDDPDAVIGALRKIFSGDFIRNEGFDEYAKEHSYMRLKEIMHGVLKC